MDEKTARQVLMDHLKDIRKEAFVAGYMSCIDEHIKKKCPEKKPGWEHFVCKNASQCFDKWLKTEVDDAS